MHWAYFLVLISHSYRSQLTLSRPTNPPSVTHKCGECKREPAFPSRGSGLYSLTPSTAYLDISYSPSHNLGEETTCQTSGYRREFAYPHGLKGRDMSWWCQPVSSLLRASSGSIHIYIGPDEVLWRDEMRPLLKFLVFDVNLNILLICVKEELHLLPHPLPQTSSGKRSLDADAPCSPHPIFPLLLLVFGKCSALRQAVVMKYPSPS